MYVLCFQTCFEVVKEGRILSFVLGYRKVLRSGIKNYCRFEPALTFLTNLEGKSDPQYNPNIFDLGNLGRGTLLNRGFIRGSYL